MSCARGKRAIDIVIFSGRNSYYYYRYRYTFYCTHVYIIHTHTHIYTCEYKKANDLRKKGHRGDYIMRCVRGRVEGDGRRVRWILFYSRPGRVVCVRARACVCVCVCALSRYFMAVCVPNRSRTIWGGGTEEEVG